MNKARWFQLATKHTPKYETGSDINEYLIYWKYVAACEAGLFEDALKAKWKMLKLYNQGD